MIPLNLQLPKSHREQIRDLIDKLEGSIGIVDPIVYFKTLTEAIKMLLEWDVIQKEAITELREDNLKMRSQLHQIKTQTALAIQWEPKVAASMLGKQIDILRQDKDTYFNEIDALKKAYTEDRVTQNYHDFCKFWSDTLGFHPFLDE